MTSAHLGRAAALALGLSVGLWLVAAPALAHPQYSPTKSNRYLKLSLSGGGVIRVAWALMVGETPALPVRRAADGNKDELVDEDELAGYAAQVARAAATGLRIDVDGAKAQVIWDTPIVGLSDRRVGPVPFSIDLVGKLAVAGPGPHVLRVDDTTEIEDLGETELRIEEGPGTRVLAAWQGHEDGGRVTRFVWNGPKFSALEDRSVGLRFVDERARRRFRPPIGLLGALLGAAVAGLLAWRGRRWRRTEAAPHTKGE